MAAAKGTQLSIKTMFSNGKSRKRKEPDTERDCELSSTSETFPHSSSTDPLMKSMGMQKPYDRDAQRTVKSAWFSDFEWLDYRDQMFFCKLCKDAKKSNIFATSGKSATKPKRDDFVKHCRGEDHRSAVHAKTLTRDLKTATVNAFSGCKEGIVAQMATVLCQAQEGIPTRKNGPLVSLQIFNGVTSLKALKVDGKDYYGHHDSIDDIYRSLEKVTRKEMTTDRESSPVSFFAIEADEATDSSNRSVLVAYIRYMGSDGDIQSKFLAAQELEGTDSDNIFKCLNRILQDHGCFLVDMVGLATDGAGVMVGVHKGMATRFKKECPWVITQHCMAHRLQLCSEKAANKVPYLVKYIAVLNQFAKTLKYSPKLCRILEECKELNGDKAGKIKQVFFTRWLFFDNSVHAIKNCLGSVISSIHAAAADRNTEGRAVLHGLVTQMSSFKFVAITSFLADAIGILGLLSRSLQRENLTYCEAKSHVDAALLAIQSLLTTPGPHTKAILQRLPDKPCSSGYTEYEGHDITDSVKDRDKYKSAIDLFVRELELHLEIAFPDADMMSSFSVFSPKDGPHCVSDINILCDHFSIFVDKQEALVEWQLLEKVMQQDTFNNADLTRFYKEYLHVNQKIYPNLCQLAAIGLIVPVTSVICERGISRYNSIKTDSRSGLSVENTEMLMTLSLEARPIQRFDFDAAFNDWISSKDRRGYQAMLNKLENRQVASSGKDQEFQAIPLDLSKHA